MRSGPLILVVEDNAILCKTIVDALEQRGYRVESAADFTEGADKLRAAAPALVVTNVNLPSGDGRNLKNLARAMDIPVLIISALPHTIDETVGVKFLQKPFLLGDLEHAVETLLSP